MDWKVTGVTVKDGSQSSSGSSLMARFDLVGYGVQLRDCSLFRGRDGRLFIRPSLTRQSADGYLVNFLGDRLRACVLDQLLPLYEDLGGEMLDDSEKVDA